MQYFKKKYVFTVAIFLVLCMVGVAFALKVGDKVTNVQIRDAQDNPATIPFLGKKVISIFYNDADAADINDPLADAIKAKKYPKDKYEGIGVANLEDSKAPNFIIRAIIRRKIKQYNSKILTDPDLILAKAWNLGNCNNTSVVIIIGKDMKVKYIKKGAVRGKEIDKVLKLLDSLIK